MIDERNIEAIAQHYGKESQIRQTAEECSELIQALCKLGRTRTPEEYSKRLDEIAEEIVDVEIMMAQLRYILGFDSELMDAMKQGKIERQIRRMCGGE